MRMTSEIDNYRKKICELVGEMESAEEWVKRWEEKVVDYRSQLYSYRAELVKLEKLRG